MAEQFFGRDGAAGPLPPGSAMPGDGPDLKTWTWIVHLLQAATLLFGITGIAAVIIAYIKREETRGTIYESHLVYAIRSFWIGIGLSLVCLVLCFLVIGFALFALVYVWYVVRVIRPVIAMLDNRPMSDPTGFF